MLRIALAAVAVSCFASQACAADDPRQILGAVRAPVVANGINDSGWVKIGGVDQWISMRGRHKDAPILLFLHGGPGFTSIPNSWLFMPEWDEFFTVAQWDQRGAGKTFARNPADSVASTMTLDRMVADAEEVAAYLRRTYHRRKIVLVGHSWGSVLGLTLAKRHPDWFYAYVGIGQAIDFPESERRGYEETLRRARAARDDKAVSELAAIAPFPNPGDSARTLKDLPTERRWLAHFGGAVWNGTEGAYDDVGKLSPDYSDSDLAARESGLGFSLKALWPQLANVSFESDVRFGCPLLFLEGRHDLVANTSVFSAWYDRVRAPRKRVVWFEDSAHMVFEEEPGRTLEALVDNVLPLTEEGAARPRRR